MDIYYFFVPNNFYPRPPRGGRRTAFRVWSTITKISIHALREEGDLSRQKKRRQNSISIHALREEGDKPKPQQHMEQKYFYPRPPRGGRPQSSTKPTALSKFLSTPSARRATGAWRQVV